MQLNHGFIALRGLLWRWTGPFITENVCELVEHPTEFAEESLEWWPDLDVECKHMGKYVVPITQFTTQVYPQHETDRNYATIIECLSLLSTRSCSKTFRRIGFVQFQFTDTYMAIVSGQGEPNVKIPGSPEVPYLIHEEREFIRDERDSETMRKVVECEERRSFSAIAAHLYKHDFIRPLRQMREDFIQENSIEHIQSPVDITLV